MIPRLSDADLDRLVEEDVPYGDLTTHALGIGAAPGRMVFTARDPLVVCGGGEAARLLTRLGAEARSLKADGDWAEPGTVLLEAGGPAGALLAGWKAAQSMMEWAAGIATATRRLCEAAPGISVACTRKSAPFTRRLSAKAVLAGGGALHRLGLSETVLLFPEHRAFLKGGIAAGIARLREKAPERAIVVEVTGEAEALAAIEAGADVVQFEKFPPETVARIVRASGRDPLAPRIPGRRPLLAAGGGVTLENAPAYAASGADILVTSAPYNAKPRDIQVRIEAV